MKILSKTSTDDIATVYVAQMNSGKIVEFVESVQPPLPLLKKWVLMISTLDGCPVECRFCDAGGFYHGILTKQEILSQIDYMITRRFPDKKIPVEKFKIQFARMGEPSFNLNVIEILKELPHFYDMPGILPSLSTIAPYGCDTFFTDLLNVKKELYPNQFQLQFSIHTTHQKKRDWLIPIKKWDFQKIQSYGNKFFNEGGRKITLNFALAEGMPIESNILLKYFNPKKFLIKITPVNPTYKAKQHNICSHITEDEKEYDIVTELKELGYDVILSIGEVKENHIGSNCGQYITNYLKNNDIIPESYTVPLTESVE